MLLMSCNVASFYLRRAVLLDSVYWGKCSIESYRYGGGAMWGGNVGAKIMGKH